MKQNIYKYFIIKDKRLIVETLSGKFELSDYIHLKQTQIQDPEFDPNFNLIMDIRNIEDLVSQNLLREYPEKLKPVQLFTTRIKFAVITNTPSQVVGASLYKLFEEDFFEYKIFSTLEYALHWMGISGSDLIEIY